MARSTLIDEAMAHSYYPSGDEVGLEPPSKHDVHSISHSMRTNCQQELVERSPSCISPALEIDGKNRNSTRRRIQVACNRCRKRKIKCSGDIGDGQGCSNCQASGNTNCQFLRVNSSMLQTKASGWPYPALNATVSPSQRPGMYAHPMAQKHGVLPMSSPSMRFGSFSRPPGFELGAFDPQHASGRPPINIDHTINYEDESTAYNPQSSAYVFPNTQQGVLADYCGLPWNSKAWSSNLQVSKASSGALFPNQEADNSFASSSYPYLFSGQGTQPMDAPPVVPTVACIPSEGQGTDRTLPNPTGRGQLQMGLPCLNTAPETIHGLHMSPEYKLGNQLTTRGTILSSRPSIQLSPNASFCGSSPSQTTKVSQSNAQDMVFDYLPMTSAGPPSHLVPSSGALSTYDTLESTEDFRGSAEGRLTRSFSQDGGRLMFMGCSPDVYGYSSSEKSRNRSEAGDTGSAATLMNGLPYTRPRHTESHTPIPFDLLATDVLSDYRGSTEIHRTAVSALGNPAGF